MADAAAPLPTIPTTSMADALVHLRRPFTAGAVKWKVQVTGPKESKEKTWATIVGYIDARLVAERLNAVVAGGWEEDEPIPVEGHPNMLRYRLKVLGQTHTDVGEGQGQSEKPGMIVKARDSDALKRAAVKFGIGAYLYAMPPFSLYVTPAGEMQDDKPTLKRMKNGKAGYLKEPHEKWLREAYEQWLADEGERLFGEPFDHGDAHAGSVGGLLEAVTEVEAGEEDLRPAELDDDESKQLRQQIAEIHGELDDINPERLAVGRVQKMVADAAHSHEALKQVAATLATLRDTERRLAELREHLIEKVGKSAAKPLIDSAERRGSQDERIAAMEQAINNAPTEPDDGK